MNADKLYNLADHHMQAMIEIRVHHLQDFAKALAHAGFRRYYVNDSYSFEQKEAVRALLGSGDLERVRIVTGLDDICRACPYTKPVPDESCLFPDSIWAAKEFMHVVEPDEVVSVGYLRKQYAFYESVRRRQDWKRFIKESRMLGNR